MCCVALPCCLFDLACFFLPSFSSLIKTRTLLLHIIHLIRRLYCVLCRTGLEELAGLQGFSSSVAAAPPSTSSASSNPFQVDSFSSPNSAWTQNAPSGKYLEISIYYEVVDSFGCSRLLIITSPGYQEVDLFSEIRGKPQPDFDSVFGSSGVPVTSSAPAAKPLMGGDLLTPVAVGVHKNMQRSQSPLLEPGLTSDVDSSLVRAAENLC